MIPALSWFAIVRIGLVQTAIGAIVVLTTSTLNRVMVVEIGLVHPPVGMNIYIINRIAKDVPVMETFKGVLPFLASDLIRTILLVFFPVISLYLVHTFGG